MEAKQARERARKREEPRSLDERRRNGSQTKYDIKFTMRALNSIYSDHRLEKEAHSEINRADSSNFNAKDMRSARRRRFVSPKENSTLSREESPYLLSATEKLNSTKTFSLHKLKNTAPFRANKYLRSKDFEQDGKREDELAGQNSLNEIGSNIETAWNSYEHTELPAQIRTKLDIECTPAVIQPTSAACASRPQFSQTQRTRRSRRRARKTSLSTTSSTRRRRACTSPR